MSHEPPENEIDAALRRVLDAAETPRPLRPMWPEVARRRARGFLPVFDLRFSMATAAALTIGFLIGVLTFNGNVDTVSTAAAPATVATADGSDWTETGPTLADLYLFDDVNSTGSIAMKRGWFILLAFSVGLNGALLYDRFMRPHGPLPHHERLDRNGPPPRMPNDHPRHGDSAGHPIHDQRMERRLERMMGVLDLSAEQRARIRSIHADSFDRILALRRDTRLLRGEMHELLASATLDSLRIRTLVMDLHEKQSELEALIMDNLLQESAVLTPEQRVRYQELMMGSRGGRGRWRR